MLNEGTGGTSEPLTATAAAEVFAGLLTSEDDESKSAATTPKPGEVVDPASEDASTEQTASTEESDEPELDDDGEPIPPRTFKVKVAGEEREVTEDELLKGYSRTEDYTRKTTEVATQRKAVAAEAEGLRVERAEYALHISQLKKALSDATPSEPDWDALAKADPNQYTATRQAWDEHTKRTNAVIAEEKKAYDAVEVDRKAKYGEYVKDEQTKLLAALPDWTQPDTKAREQAELTKYAKSVGFDDADIAGVTDHRLVLVLRAAMLHQKGLAAKPDVAKKIADATVVVAPGSGDKGKPKSTPEKDAQTRLAKTGRVDDAAAAIAHLL